MAKSKDTTALFEVIARSRPTTGRRGLLGAMADWLGSRPRAGGAGAVVAGSIADSGPTPPLPMRGGGMMMDGERQEISLRLSYGSAVIGVFALVTLVAASFLAGRKTAVVAQPLLSISTEELRRGPVAPEVTNLQKTAVEAPVAALPGPGTAAGQPQAAAVPPQPAGHVVRDRNRSVGLNYVIIQSYPNEKMANDAAKALLDNKIDCTVEKKIPGKGFPEEWWKVVGTDGFAKISSPEYGAYVERIKRISDQYAKKNNFRAFEPAAMKWGR
jgi:hypothetical protein